MAVLVFANGDLATTAWVEPFLSRATVVIAADGGARHLLALQRPPDIVVGDLDSFPKETRAQLEAAGTEFAQHPEAKDETDLELALLYAAAHYEEEILIFAGLGGRLDQLFANVLLLMHPALRRRSVRFLTEYQKIWLVLDETKIAGDAGDTVSLIPLGGDVHVVETSGLRWPLRNETLSFGPARGLSNVLTENPAKVVVQSGCLLCVHTKQVWKR